MIPLDPMPPRLATAAAPAPPPPRASPAPLAHTLAATVGPVGARGGKSSEGPVLRTLGSLAAVAALYLARDVLVLLALGAFVAFLLAPVARFLEWLRLPRGVAATGSVLALGAAMAGVLWIAALQGIDLARHLPEYRERIETKLEALRSGAVASPILEASNRLKELQGDLEPQTPPKDGSGSAVPDPRARRTPEAVTVRVVQDSATPLQLLAAVAGSVVGPLISAGVVLLLAIFLLGYRVDVRERLLRLGPVHRIGVTGQALEEVGRLVARYLLANLAVNVLYGAAVGLGIHLIGVPSAWLWGLLCALLRFIPYAGTWLGAALPLAVSFAVFDGWGRTGLVFATILGCDVIVGNLVEPIAYGRRTGLSPLAVVLATLFWTWLWGVPGLLIAVPMTLCLAVVGRFVPGFGLFHVLLGDQPVLDPAERAYDRLVALDAAGAARVVTEAAAKGSPAAAHDDILLGAMRRAEADRRAGVLDEERYRGVCDAVRAAMDDLELPEPAPGRTGRVLCLPAFSESDRVAGEMLAKHLASLGIEVELPAGAVPAPDAIARAVAAGIDAIYVVALPPFAALRARHVLRGARLQAPNARILALVLDPTADRVRVAAALRRAGADATPFSLAEAIDSFAPAATVPDATTDREPAAASRAGSGTPMDGSPR